MSPRNPRADRISGRREHGGLLIVPVVCNEIGIVAFLVDTGASLTTISNRVARRLAIDLDSPLRLQPIACPGPLTLSAPIVRMRSLRIGGLEVADLEVAVVAFPENLRFDGLLGVNVLQRFRPTLEFDTATLVLRTRERAWRDLR